MAEQELAPAAIEQPDRPPVWGPEERRVADWLGLGSFPPDGLHGRNRGRLTRRHTVDRYDPDNRHQGLNVALRRAYPASREKPLLMLLRQQQLDDALWRMVYAVMVQGGPINLFSLVYSLTRLVSHDRKVADAEAKRLAMNWYSFVDHPPKSGDGDDAEPAADTPAKRGPGRPATGRSKITVTTTLSPDVDAARKASGQTIDALLRQSLGLPEKP